MSTGFQYCSDLHLEFDLNRKRVHKYPLKIAGDILLLAGDIGLFRHPELHHDFLDFVSRNYTAVYWIPGNHEYYSGDISFRSGVLHEAVKENVFLVNNTTVKIGDTDLFCTTLWSKIDVINAVTISKVLSDFQVIANGGKRLDVEVYNGLHDSARNYLTQALFASNAANKVVMTHHAPTFMNYPGKYLGDPLNTAFVTEFFNLIEVCNAAYWVYGHTHYNTPDFKIGNTTLCTNQLGYVRHGEHKDFSNSKSFSL